MSLLSFLPDAIPCFFQLFDFSPKPLPRPPGPGRFHEEKRASDGERQCNRVNRRRDPGIWFQQNQRAPSRRERQRDTGRSPGPPASHGPAGRIHGRVLRRDFLAQIHILLIYRPLLFVCFLHFRLPVHLTAKDRTEPLQLFPRCAALLFNAACSPLQILLLIIQAPETNKPLGKLLRPDVRIQPAEGRELLPFRPQPGELVLRSRESRADLLETQLQSALLSGEAIQLIQMIHRHFAITIELRDSPADFQQAGFYLLQLPNSS